MSERHSKTRKVGEENDATVVQGGHEIINYLDPFDSDEELQEEDPIIVGPTSLVDRLGTATCDKKGVPSTFVMAPGFLDPLGLGVVNERDLENEYERSRERRMQLEEGLLTDMDGASEDFDKSFFSLRLDLVLSPNLVKTILKRMEDSIEFFPIETFRCLLGHRKVSDHAHPRLIERMIGNERLLQVLNEYIAKVGDLREESLLKTVLHYLSLPEKVFSRLVPPAGISPRECHLLHALACPMDLASVKALARVLSSEQIGLLLDLLMKLLKNYALTNAGSFQSLKIKKRTFCRIPSKMQLLQWLIVLIDSHYPDLLLNERLLERLGFIQEAMVRDIIITDGFLGLKAFIPSVSCGASREVATAATPLSGKCEEYSVEFVSF